MTPKSVQNYVVQKAIGFQRLQSRTVNTQHVTLTTELVKNTNSYSLSASIH